jgi:CDP-4-dehydro-6-deoxyglucose reductase
MMETTSAEVEQIFPLTDSILQLILNPQSYVDYIAGQYLEIIRGEERYAYSIANAPLGSHKYELHIRHSKDKPYNAALFADIRKSGKVALCVPSGDCHLQKLEEKKPILFIAGGTGFAPIKAMIEQLLANGDQRKFELFWGARSHSDLYMDEQVTRWHTHVPSFRYFSSISKSDKGKLIDKVLSEHPKDLSAWQIVIGGPFDLVYLIREKLLAAGALPELLFSDAFSFEK